MKRRPDSELTKLITPMMRGPATIGTTITQRMPEAASASRCSGSTIAASSSAVVDRADQLRGAVAQDLGRPIGASAGVG